MDLEYALKALALVTAALSGSFAAVQAGRSWLQRTKDLRRGESASRAAELGKLHISFKAVGDTFAQIFDYTSVLDRALRLENLSFSDDEAQTRTRVDEAFSFLRELHTAVRLDLIDRSDLGPWAYWIHRIDTRPAIKSYSAACAYEVFRQDLVSWTEGSPEISMLARMCPWWTETRG
jgi:hypothetical protein